MLIDKVDMDVKAKQGRPGATEIGDLQLTGSVQGDEHATVLDQKHVKFGFHQIEVGETGSLGRVPSQVVEHDGNVKIQARIGIK